MFPEPGVRGLADPFIWPKGPAQAGPGPAIQAQCSPSADFHFATLSAWQYFFPGYEIIHPLSDPASLMNFSHIQFIFNWTPRNCHSVLFDLEVQDDKRDCHLSWRRRLFHLKADFIGLCLLSCRSSPAFGNGAHKFRPGPPLPLTQRLWYLPTSITKLSLH